MREGAQTHPFGLNTEWWRFQPIGTDTELVLTLQPAGRESALQQKERNRARYSQYKVKSGPAQECV